MGIPILFQLPHTYVLSPHICFLYQKYSIVGFVLKTDFTRAILTFILHKGNKVAKKHKVEILEGKQDAKYT